MNDTTFRETREIRSCLFGKVYFSFVSNQNRKFLDSVPGQGVSSLPILLSIVGILDEIQ